MALRISSLSPSANVSGLWIIMTATGDMSTRVPAMAMTEAALAAMPSILTVISFCAPSALQPVFRVSAFAGNP